MENYVVTFARGFGTGGKEIASKLAKELGIHCYENRILTLASQMSGLDEKLFQEVNEKVRSNGGFSSFLKGLPRAKSYISRNEKFVSDDKLFEYQKQIIENLADTESCVIVGKCADYILRGSDCSAAACTHSMSRSETFRFAHYFFKIKCHLDSLRYFLSPIYLNCSTSCLPDT